MIIRYVCRLIGGISVAKNHIRGLEMGAARERHRSIDLDRETRDRRWHVLRRVLQTGAREIARDCSGKKVSVVDS